MKAFDNKIKISDEENKEKILYIKVNFLTPENILNKETVTKDIKDYYKFIYNMYMKELGGHVPQRRAAGENTPEVV